MWGEKIGSFRQDKKEGEVKKQTKNPTIWTD